MPPSKKKLSSRENAKLSSLTRVVEKLREQLSDEKEKHIAVVGSIRDRIEKSQTEKSNLRESVKTIEDENKNMKSSLKKSNTECGRIRNSILASEKNLEITTAKLKNSEQKRVDIEMKLLVYMRDDMKTFQPFSTLLEHVSKMNRIKIALEMMTRLSGEDDYEPMMIFMVNNVRRKDGTRWFQLTPFDGWQMKTIFHMSDGMLKRLGPFLEAHLKIKVLPAREKIAELERVYDNSQYYDVIIVEKQIKNKKYQTAVIVANDVRSLASDRLTVLHKYGNLRLRGDEEIVIMWSGDKGDDDVKVMFAIESSENPNSPFGLTFAVVWEGKECYEEIEKYCTKVFNQANNIKTIQYEEDGHIVERKVRHKSTGDYKWISSINGHAGQSAERPCVKCDAKLCTHGKDADLIKNATFALKFNLRTLKTMMEQLENGSKSMKVGRRMLLLVDPEDIEPGTMHTVNGCFEKYVADNLVAKCNKLDRINIVGVDLKDQKKGLDELRKLENYAKIQLQNAKLYFESSLKMKDGISNHKVPKNRKCHSDYCIIDLCETDTIDWVQCDGCSKDLHLFCEFIVTADEKLDIEHIRTKYSCLNCRGVDLRMRQNYTIEAHIFFTDELAKCENEYEALKKSRESQEEIVEGFTGAHYQKLQKIFEKIGCSTRIWYSKMVGNQIRKCLRPENIETILEVFSEDQDFVTKMRPVMILLGRIMSYSGLTYFTDQDIIDLDKTIIDFVHSLKLLCPEMVVIPKLHNLMFHVVPYVRKFRTWGGLCSEQTTEHGHVIYRNAKNAFIAVKDLLLRSKLTIRRLNQLTTLHDMGY